MDSKQPRRKYSDYGVRRDSFLQVPSTYVLLNQYAPMQNLDLLEKPSQSLFTDIQTQKQETTRATHERSRTKRTLNGTLLRWSLVNQWPPSSKKGKARTEPCLGGSLSRPTTMHTIRTEYMILESLRSALSTGCFPVHDEITSEQPDNPVRLAVFYSAEYLSWNNAGGFRFVCTL